MGLLGEGYLRRCNGLILLLFPQVLLLALLLVDMCFFSWLLVRNFRLRCFCLFRILWLRRLGTRFAGALLLNLFGLLLLDILLMFFSGRACVVTLIRLLNHEKLKITNN